MAFPRALSKLAALLSSTGIVTVAGGGTGLTAPGASGNVLTSNGTGWVSSPPSGGGGGGPVLISSVTVSPGSPVANIDFTIPDPTIYSSYELRVSNYSTVASDAVAVRLAVGGVYQTGTSAYKYAYRVAGTGGYEALNKTNTIQDSKMATGVGNNTVGNPLYAGGCVIDIMGVNSDSRGATLAWSGFGASADGNWYYAYGGGQCMFAGPVNGVRVLNGSLGGSINGGTYSLYGIV